MATGPCPPHRPERKTRCAATTRAGALTHRWSRAYGLASTAKTQSCRDTPRSTQGMNGMKVKMMQDARASGVGCAPHGAARRTHDDSGADCSTRARRSRVPIARGGPTANPSATRVPVGGVNGTTSARARCHHCWKRWGRVPDRAEAVRGRVSLSAIWWTPMADATHLRTRFGGR